MQRAILLAALSLPAFAMAADMQPGKYRIAAKVNGQADPKAEDKCITQREIDSGLTEMGVQEDNKSCKVLDFKRAAGSVSYRTICKEGNVGRMSVVSGTLAADRFELNMFIKAGGETNNLVISGRRLGAC